MKRAVKTVRKPARRQPERETLTEACEVRAFRDELDNVRPADLDIPEIAQADPGAFEAIKKMAKGHGEQTVLPDDCQYGDNDLCYVDA